MKLEDFNEQLSREAVYCPARDVCPLAFMCAARQDDGRLLLPTFTDAGREDLVWTDLGPRLRVYAVRDGVFLTKAYANDDREFPYGLIGRGFTAGLTELYTDMTASSFYYFQGLVPGRLCSFEGADVRSAVEKLSSRDVRGLMTTTLLNSSTANYSQALTLTHNSTRGRVISVLIRVSKTLGVEGGFAEELPLTHADVAFMASAERTTVSHELKVMDREGLIRLGYRLIALTPAFIESFDDLAEARLSFFPWQPMDLPGF